jgi:outer membrane protein TolC
MTLNDAIAIGLADNPALEEAGQNLYFAHGRVGVAATGWYPTLSVNGPGEQYINSIGAPAYAIQATLPLDISQLVRAATQQAEFQEIAARLDVNRVRNEVVYGIENAFYETLRAKALLDVAQENLTTSMEELYDAQARYTARTVAYIDVVRAQTDVANAQNSLIAAKSAVSNALATLAIRMGIDVSSNLTLTDAGAVESPTIPNVPREPVTKPAISMEPMTNPSQATRVSRSDGLDLGEPFHAALAEALGTRPEILEDDAAIAAAKRGILVARRSELPTFGLTVGYYDERSTTGGQINQPQAFLGFNIPIFDAGLARARVQEARATVSSAVTNRRQETDQVTLEVQQAYLALAQARDQVVVAQQALIEARTAFDLARVRYNTGVSAHAGISPLLELTDAQAALTQADQNQVNALYNFNDARAALDRSIGRFAYIATGPGYPAAPPATAVGGK